MFSLLGDECGDGGGGGGDGGSSEANEKRRSAQKTLCDTCI